MCNDPPDPQRKPSHTGISRLILSLRTGLTLKPAEDVVMVLKNLACRLTTPSQWQLATSQGYLELLATSLNHKYKEVRECAFVVIMECLSAQKMTENTQPPIPWLLKLAREFVENSEIDSSFSSVFFKTIGSLCSQSHVLRDEVLKVVTPSALQSIRPEKLSHDARMQFIRVIQAVASHGIGDASLAVPLSVALETIVASSQESCEISEATCTTLSLITRNQNLSFLLESSKLICRLSEHVASVHCSDACSATYIELVESILRLHGAGPLFVSNYGLDALHVIVYNRHLASPAQVCRVLAKLLSGSPNQISMVVHHKLLSPLVILLADKEAEVRNEAKSALRNFMARANFGHWYQAVQLGFVESLLIPLLSETAVVVSQVLNVCFEVMHSSKDAEIDCYVLQRMLNNDMHEIFEMMSFHGDDKVVSLSRKFFDKFFREEFAEDDIEQESSF